MLLEQEMLLPLIPTIALTYFFAVPVATELTPVVKIDSGLVQGEFLTNVNSVKYAAFKGIPYAKAPVGYLRFKPPVAPDPWKGVYNATTDAADCIHFDPSSRLVVGDEDCLFLNVVTLQVKTKEKSTQPKSKSESESESNSCMLPVLVWIYGGSFVTGSSTLEKFPPDYLLEKDIVFVSLNYRGGAFGYMALGHRNATGNVGLKDLVFGLKWVQRNIKQFCGNPKNVTIFGGSSGSAAVSYLVLSDAAAGLFHASISMSGVPMNPWAFQSPVRSLQQAYKLATRLNFNWTDVESLLASFYNTSAYDIAKETAFIGRNFAPFAPTIEDKEIAIDPFLTECSVLKYLTGNFTKIPQIIGFEDQETVAFVTFPDVISEIVEQSTLASFRYQMDIPQSIVSAQERFHNNDSFFTNLSYPELRKFINESSDLLYISQIDQTQQFLSINNDNKPVFYYHISYYAPGPHILAWNNSLPGAAHGDDTGFIFYFASMNYSSDPMDPTRRTINRMNTLWTNFIKHGHPTPHWVNDSYPLNITWPESGTSGISLEIGTELKVAPRPVTDNIKNLQFRSFPHLARANGCFL